MNNARIVFSGRNIPLNLTGLGLWRSVYDIVYRVEGVRNDREWQTSPYLGLDWVRYGSLRDPGFTVRSV